jgi:putative ABC transport system permease protein
MGAILLICRLVARDLRHHSAEAVLMLLAITAATTTLTLGLALHGVTSHPYQQTRAATAGPDVVAQFGGVPGNIGPGNTGQQARALARAAGVTGYSGPYPIVAAALRTHGITVVAEAEGRDQAPARVDQPELTQGSWVSPGAVVLERTFAGVLGVRAGDSITLDGRRFRVAGTAVTAAVPPYPNVCETGCDLNGGPGPGQYAGRGPGLIWVIQADARRLATAATPPNYVMNLKLADPAQAPAFAGRFDNNPNSTVNLMPWQTIRDADALLVTDEQQVLTVGSWLLGLLAVASVAVFAGGRMAEQTRRVGLLKAVGGTPGLVAAVLLTENLVLALIAAAAGLAAGWLAAPLFTSPGAGLIGTPDAPSLTLATAKVVVAVALAVALAATLIPALRAARTSTVAALADAARAPRRRGWLIAISARLPVPLLLGLRLAGRRPRRAVLSAASIAVTVTGIVAVLAFHATAGERRFGGSSGLTDPVAVRDSQVLLVITVALVALAALNAIFTTWAAVLEARHSSALTRALGATPQQVSAGFSAAQLLSALPGAIVGVPLGIELFRAANRAGILTIPPAWWLIAAVLGTLLVVAGLTTIPARIGARRPAAEILQSETA